jgi:hypothetical protein
VLLLLLLVPAAWLLLLLPSGGKLLLLLLLSGEPAWRSSASMAPATCSTNALAPSREPTPFCASAAKSGSFKTSTMRTAAIICLTLMPCIIVTPYGSCIACSSTCGIGWLLFCFQQRLIVALVDLILAVRALSTVSSSCHMS